MKKTYCFLLTFFCAMFAYGNQPFVVNYSFNNEMSPTIQKGAEAVGVHDAKAGGSKLSGSSFVTEANNIVWRGEFKSNTTNFTNTFMRMDIYPKSSYQLKVDSVVFRQKSSIIGGAYNFRTGCTLNGVTPNADQSSVTQYFTKDYSNYKYIPKSEADATADGLNYMSIWVTARGLNNELLYWYVDDVTIYGSYSSIGDETSVVTVSTNKKQKIRLGIDAERLWYWRSGIKDQLAKAAVGDLEVDYARVAINAAYELQQGTKNETAYKDILEVMTVFRKANPNLNFFASPRPLMEAYSSEERVQLFGHVDNVPWSPYPLWIQKWVQDGTTTMADGTVVPKWVKSEFDADALIQYYADYLNLVHTKGFDIEFLDLSNEQTIITPAISKYIADNLPAKLGSGVKMPKIVVPSTWSIQGGIDWMDAIDKSKDEHLAFDVVAGHNTGVGTVSEFEEFATKAQALGKEAWNSELHEWTGIELHDEIINSSIFWEHMRAGFTGIDTWLFFGPGAGKPHSMIFAFPGRYVTTGKYEIFKQIVNNSNGGNYIEVTQPYTSTPTSAFLRDNQLSIWMLNKNTLSMNDVLFKLSGWTLTSQEIEVVRWHKDLPKEGEVSTFMLASNDEFNYTIDSESLYNFKIKVDGGSSLNDTATSVEANFAIQVNLMSEKVSIHGQNLIDGDSKGLYSIMNMHGQLIEKGELTGELTEIKTEKLQSGVYIVSIEYMDQRFNKKVLIK